MSAFFTRINSAQGPGRIALFNDFGCPKRIELNETQE